ncbi:DUF6526 family protein [Paenibacillus harenae]
MRTIPAFHYFLVPLGLATSAASIAYLFVAERSWETLFTSLIAVSLSLMAVMTMVFARMFACKAQDRAIRAEENLRHFVLTGKRLDPRLNMSQIIALRFASDDEFLSLCERGAETDMASDDIKRSIQSWKADYDRV